MEGGYVDGPPMKVIDVYFGKRVRPLESMPFAMRQWGRIRQWARRPIVIDQVGTEGEVMADYDWTLEDDSGGFVAARSVDDEPDDTRRELDRIWRALSILAEEIEKGREPHGPGTSFRIRGH